MNEQSIADILRQLVMPDSRDDLLEVIATTTPLQRLEWLEEMLDLAYETGALARAWQLEDERRHGRDTTPPEGPR